MDKLDRISQNPKVMGGRPCIRGMRVTVGMVVGLVLLLNQGGPLQWNSPKVLSTIGLWLVFAILLYLRYGIHVRGKQAALWTMVAFVLLLVALVSQHSFPQEGAL